MKHKGIRITLVVIALFVGLWAIIGGVGLMTGAIPFLRMPVEYLQGSPFSDYTIPGLLLLLVADEQMSYEEVATLTEQTTDAVRGKLHRARKVFAVLFPERPMDVLAFNLTHLRALQLEWKAAGYEMAFHTSATLTGQQFARRLGELAA